MKLSSVTRTRELGRCLNDRASGNSTSSGLRSVTLSICFDIAPSKPPPTGFHSGTVVTSNSHVTLESHKLGLVSFQGTAIQEQGFSQQPQECAQDVRLLRHHQHRATAEQSSGMILNQRGDPGSLHSLILYACTHVLIFPSLCSPSIGSRVVQVLQSQEPAKCNPLLCTILNSQSLPLMP